MQPNPYLVATSLLFLIPAGCAASQGLPVYAGIWTGMTIISATYHATKDPVIFWVDQAACATSIGALVLAGEPRITAATLLSCGFLYYYGWLTQSLVWGSNGTPWHVLMHLIATAGATTCIRLKE